LILESTLTQAPKVKELRDFFKKAGFTKTFRTNQAKKHSQQKAENSDRFVCLDLRKSRLQTGLDKYLVLEAFTILKCQTTPLTLVTLDHFSHFSHF
jgi:hypothetical protein